MLKGLYCLKTKIKTAVSVLLICAVALTFSGCQDDGSEVTEATLPVTDESGNAVTDDEGNPQTVPAITVTDDDGKPVTDESGNEVLVPAVAVTDKEGNVMTDEDGNTLYEPVIDKVDYKVGFIYNGKVSDGATNAVFEDARHKIEKSLGLETCYIEDVLVADFPEAVNVLKENDCNIIVSCSPRFANSAAKESKFADGTYYLSFGSKTSGRSIGGFGGELYQTAAICGLAAAHNTKSNVIGVIADPGSYNVYGVIDAFILGAAEIWSVYTDVRINWAWSNDNAAIEKAADDLISQGCDVIMSYMESDHALEYLASKNVGVIGNAYNISEIAPDNYLTGFFFNFSTYLIDQVRAIANDFFTSGLYTGGIAEGCARLADFGPSCVEGTEDICTAYAPYIRDRKALIFQGEIKNSKGAVVIEKGQAMSPENILKIDWLVQGARRVKDFTDVTQNPVSSTFDIKS